MHDYLIIGAGLFGSVFARQMADYGKTSLILEKRNHVGGNVYSEQIEGIQVHRYGPHLFHTNDKGIWDWLHRFTQFNNYRHKVKAKCQNEIYSMPINMNTFNKLWGCVTPIDARREVEKRKIKIDNPANLEEWVLSQVGEEIYEKLIYGYTKKQWNHSPRELPASIIKRLPLRFTYNDDYHKDRYQGMPVNGFTRVIENILDHHHITVKLNEEFKPTVDDWKSKARKLVFSGCIDEFFGHKFGYLEYRSLTFHTEICNGDHQGIGQMNYTDESVPYTRIIEHKHFAFQESPKTVLTYEYPKDWQPGRPPYLPVNDTKNNELYKKYKEEAKLDDVIYGGRLGTFQYLDMHQVIGMALMMARKE